MHRDPPALKYKHRGPCAGRPGRPCCAQVIKKVYLVQSLLHFIGHDLVGKIVGTAAPFAALAAVPGLTLPESQEEKENLIEEIERIKQLIN